MFLNWFTTLMFGLFSQKPFINIKDDQELLNYYQVLFKVFFHLINLLNILQYFIVSLLLVLAIRGK